jgi:hypothetical protein
MQVIESDSLAAVFHTVSSEVKIAAIAAVPQIGRKMVVPPMQSLLVSTGHL